MIFTPQINTLKCFHNDTLLLKYLQNSDLHYNFAPGVDQNSTSDITGSRARFPG